MDPHRIRHLGSFSIGVHMIFDDLRFLNDSLLTGSQHESEHTALNGSFSFHLYPSDTG